MSEFKKITNEIVKFRDVRDWKQFHNSKDLSLAISIEAAELNQLFLWKKAEEVDLEKLKEELSDVLIFSILLAHKHNFDIGEIIGQKLKANDLKYPVDKAKGTAKKYTEL